MVGAMPVNLIPKFYNGTMDSHNGIEENEIQVNVGSRIKCGEEYGTVKFIGEISGYKGVWYGVEWDDAARGKHDGCVDDVHYFKTSKPGAGSFVRPSKISPLKTCADAIRRYYGDREDEAVAAHRRTVINEWKREMGAPFIEMVGFEKIHQKQKFDRLLEICVHDQNIAKAGDVAALCPNVRSLDVSSNLFSGWREIITLSAQLPDLKELDVSKNRMAIDFPEQTLSQLSTHFKTLEKLNISVCNYTWSDILTLSHLWPNITELVAAYNNITTMTDPGLYANINAMTDPGHYHNINVMTDPGLYSNISAMTDPGLYHINAMTDPGLGNLTVLRLDGNPISSWYEVMNIGRLRLKVLSLNDCFIEEIRFGDDHQMIDDGDDHQVDDEGKVDLFEELEVLFLNRNRINDWRSLSELNKLKSLKKMYFLKNPIQSTEDYDTGSQMIMAKIGTLMELNGSLITPELRRGAEYDYMKRFGAEWKVARQEPLKAREFDLEHCRFQHLINKYGIPDDSLLVKKSKKMTLTSQLLEITLTDTNGKIFKKKFPSTMAVQKLVTLAQRLYSKFGHHGTPTLHLLDEQMDGAEITLDNNMKDLAYFSIKNGDTVLVRFR